MHPLGSRYGQLASHVPVSPFTGELQTLLTLYLSGDLLQIPCSQLNACHAFDHGLQGVPVLDGVQEL